MAKSSAKPNPAPITVKPTRIRLNRHAKDKLLDYMVTQFDSRIDDTELNATLDDILSRTNAILRAKYPEDDMVVLRKYKVTRLDHCIRFTVLDTQRIFSVCLTLRQAEGRLADIPFLSGCYKTDIFPCDKEFEALSDKWERLTDSRTDLVLGKRIEYRSFLETCRYLEEVEAVVPLTEDIRKTIGAQGRSLTVINPDVLKRIKSDFAQGVAA
jgi:hypothetical protein